MRSDAKYYAPDEEKGGYRYIGKYYRFGATGERLKRKKRAVFLCALFPFAAFLLAGFADRGETQALYVGLPYVISLLPAGFGLAAAFDLLRAEESMTYPRYRRGPRRLILCAVSGTILSAFGLIGCVFLRVRGGAVGFYFPLYLVIMLLAFGASWLIYARDPARPVG